MKQLQAGFPIRYRHSFEISALNKLGSSVCSESRLLLIGGRLGATLARWLLCFNGTFAVRHPLRLGTSVLCRRHFFKELSPACVATLKGHGDCVTSVAFHPTLQLMVTGGNDNTVKLWQLSSDSSSATCVATLEGHIYGVCSVAFHLSAPLLATGGHDKALKLWRLSDNCSISIPSRMQPVLFPRQPFDPFRTFPSAAF